MRMTLYYLTRSVKNQIRKLLHTWVAVFLLVCLLFGLVIGFGAGALASLIEGDTPDEELEEVLPEEEVEEIVLTVEERNAIVELAVGGISLLMLVMAVLSADKSGGSIFLPADVNLLFPAPIKPQTVLLFRLIMQTGAMLLATIYLLFQIPSMLAAAGLGFFPIFFAILAWLYLLIATRLVSVLVYTVTTTHPRLKRHLRSVLLALLALLGVAFLLFAKDEENYMLAAIRFFNAPVSRYIPLWGWLKAMVMLSLEGKQALAALSLGALLALLLVLVLIIWHLRADFYEDAMVRSEETAAAQAQMQNANALKKRKRDRSDRLRRDGFDKGAGASVYFHKALYNRFRFAHLRVFTKTSETYLAVGVGVALLLRFTSENPFYPLIPMLLAGMAFFRSLGNPLADDAEKESFFLVPDSAHRKVLFAFAGGVVNSALDLLPAMLLSALVLLPSPPEAIAWYVLAVSIGAYCDGVALFINLSLSTGLSQTIKSIVQIMFIYFGLLPAAALLAVGYILKLPMLFIGLVILFNLAVTALSLIISPLFVERGRR